MEEFMFKVKEFGAAGDGITKDTAAIQAAIDAASAAGGGIVFLDPGTYLTGSIFLKSYVTLEFSPGSTLKGSPDIADYPRQFFAQSISLHEPDYQWHHLIIATNAEYVTIRGSGVIDGSGPAFWHKGQFPPRKWIGYDVPRIEKMLIFYQCKNVRIQDVTLFNSPAWHLHILECDRVWIQGVSVDGRLFGPNVDGIDVQGSADVFISDCRFECGDDAIVMFTTPNRGCERVTVTNCTFRTNCVAFKAYINIESKHAIRDLVFTNSVIWRSTRAVALYLFAHSLIENVLVSNIVCDTESHYHLNRPLQIDCKRASSGSAVVESHSPVPRGRVRNVQFSNVVCRTDGRILLTAADDMRIENVVLRDVRMSYPTIDDPSVTAKNVESDQFANHSPEARVARAALAADGVDGLYVDNLQVEWPTKDNKWIRWDGLQNEEGKPRPYIRGEDVKAGDEPPFSVGWFRKCTKVLLNCPFAEQNGNVKKYETVDTEIDVIR